MAGKQREHLLCAIDEFAVGFAVDNSGGKQHGMKMVLTKTGALVADGSGTVRMQWKWDRTAQNSGKAPTGPVVIKLNAALTLTLLDRLTIGVRFSCDGCLKEFDLGAKVKRDGSYLDLAELDPLVSGKRLPVFNHVTLLERQAGFAEECRAKANLLRPSSEKLGGAFGPVVLGLERAFDGYAGTHCTTRFLDPAWRGDSEAATRAELPPIALAGTESGPVRGFGGSLYLTPEALAAAAEAERLAGPPSSTMALSRSGAPGVGFGATTGVGSGATVGPGGRSVRLDGIPDHLRDLRTGGFKNDFEVKAAVLAANPLLPRTSLLKTSSGRYSMDLVVPGKGRAHSRNPTGKAESLRRPLPAVRADDLETFLREGCSAAQVVAVFCLRDDDRSSRKAAAVAEACHGLLLSRGAAPLGADAQALLNAAPPVLAPGTEEAFDPLAAEARLVYVDMAESRTMTRKYGVRTVPFVLLFYGSRLVYGGTLGGMGQRVPPAGGAKGAGARPWRFLLVEPNVAEQVKTEGCLRKLQLKGDLTWDLCLSGPDAVARRQRTAAAAAEAAASSLPGADGGEYDCVLLSDALSEADVAAVERAFKKPGVRSGPPPLVVGMATVYGSNGTGAGEGGVSGYEKLGAVTWAEGSSRTFASDAASKKALLPTDRHAGASDVVITKPVRMAALEALSGLLGRRLVASGQASRSDGASMGMTLKVLLGALIKGLDDGRKNAAGGGDLSTLAAKHQQLGEATLARKGRDGDRRDGDLGGLLCSAETTWRGLTLDRGGLSSLQGQ